MEIIRLGTEREVCWDERLFDRADGVAVKLHHPERRGVALKCDAPWEGNVCGYVQLMEDGGAVRMYYRGGDLRLTYDGSPSYESPLLYCCAESADGKSFTRPPFGIVAFGGRRDNNVFMPQSLDNLCVFKDTNPDCPPEERYKGFAGEDNQKLVYYKSADGLHFERVGVLLDDGAYDSLNVMFWDEKRRQYFFYYRGIHRSGSDGSKWGAPETYGEAVRDVRVRTSPDFKTWSEPRRIAFADVQDDYQLYTSMIKPYYRSKGVFLGMPTRYIERFSPDEKVNYKYLPDAKNRANQIRAWGRSGYAMTDCVLMTTRDGVNFRRTDEAFMTPNIESGSNWYYGDCYPAWGIIETESDVPGAPRELSIYVGENYRVKPVEIVRYAIRIDGFFSWSCGYRPGSVLTKPFTFDGDNLEINFATSALGYVRLTLCGEDGEPLDGFRSGELFGDSLARPVDFGGDLASLAGKPVRMLAELRDAELYSFKFNSPLPF